MGIKAMVWEVCEDQVRRSHGAVSRDTATRLENEPRSGGCAARSMNSASWQYRQRRVANYRLAIFWAMYRMSLRSSSSALLNRRRSLLRKRASLPVLPQAMSSDDLRLGRFGN